MLMLMICFGLVFLILFESVFGMLIEKMCGSDVRCFLSVRILRLGMIGMLILVVW